MKPIDILKLQALKLYPNLILDIKSAEKFESNNDFDRSGERYKTIGKKLLELNSTVFAIDYYSKATEVFLKCEKYERAINCELSIAQIQRLNNNLPGIASAYEKVASYYKYFLLKNETAASYYFMSAKIHEENQNYFSAFKKAKFASDCLENSGNIEKKTSAHSLAFRMALQSKYFERAGIHAKKWLELMRKDYSPHYISVCMKGYKSFIDTDNSADALMFVNEIIIAHYEKDKPQFRILKYLYDAQKCTINEHKQIDEIYNSRILLENGENLKDSIKYSVEFKSYCQNLGLINLADKFYIQEKELIRKQAKKLKDYFLFINLSLWKYSCDYGTNIFRWFVTSALIIIFFGLVYSQYHYEFINSDLNNIAKAIKPSISISSVNTWFSPYYYSVVTFATLGYGDIVPSDLSGQFFSVIEVISGYLMLGGLLSVFSKKFIR